MTILAAIGFIALILISAGLLLGIIYCVLLLFELKEKNRVLSDKLTLLDKESEYNLLSILEVQEALLTHLKRGKK